LSLESPSVDKNSWHGYVGQA